MEHDLVLTGPGVRLVPLAPEHATALAAIVDLDLWRGMGSPLPDSAERMGEEIAGALRAPDRLAFAVLGDDDEVRGSTSFYDWVPRVPRVEVGHTYYARPWWGGTTNPACKLVLLTHAFEEWGCERVALRADSRNTRSIAAIRRLGAQPEGVLRRHRRSPDGTVADTAYFSVLADEWPAVRAGLLARLAGPPA
ncbi:GNAT family N-acetyltransferase [Cellulomonas massiliensis]|uniref:GNAT family N-acetyltransferase n=1 Tax=Cellulomonas massiliensis TaxID=1465811 RepID=UPI0002FCB9D2|nr:GNAT family protein [Cellulomonas massiliensis]